MLRPERMSKVSVTGARRVMPEVIEAVHDRNLLHLSEYGGEFEGFEGGDPVEGAESASEKLVTVRSLESILGVTGADAGPPRIVENLDEELAAVREAVNELDDRRNELRDDRRAVEDAIETAEPFVDLGIDLDLLEGYDHLDVAVGIGDREAVERALHESPDVGAHEVFPREDAAHDTVAAFAYPAGSLEDALVGVEFSAIEVPDPGDGPVDPEAYVAELEHEREEIDSKLERVESELEELRVEHAGFLLAAEERLAIEVQKAEAPLNFATTERAFVAEGWVPTARYDEFEAAVREAVGDSVDIEEVERADYADYAPGAHHDEEAAADGGTTIGDDGPPVVQNNHPLFKPFELLVETINRPQYGEIDPTVVLFLTFPAFYGFMIGDLGYGLLYTGIGYWLYSSFDSAAFRSLGGIAMWAGGFTALFGVLYGEIFGFHVLGELLWGTEEHAGLLLTLGHPPIEKGLNALEFAQLWLAVSLVVGIVHLGTGWLFGFANDARGHGLRDAVLEDVGPLLLMVGVIGWVFSTHLEGVKPDFLFAVLSRSGAPIPGTSGATATTEQVAFALGFSGFSADVGIAALAVAAAGFVLLVAGEGAVGLLESPTYALVNVLSYTRIAAVLLAKAGMAFVVNLLVVGAYSEKGEVHFMLTHGPEWVAGHHADATIVFPGMIHSGVGGVLGGLVVLVVGHLLVLALGVTSAGLQAVRLEYVEFFSKFYEGGGTEYEPFGYERTHTAED
ncbi:MAG: V-type ATP synthase subunit I [Halobacteriaceae archaeon]